MNIIKITSVLLFCAALTALSARLLHADWFYGVSNPFILTVCSIASVIFLMAKGEKINKFRIAGIALILLVLVIAGAMATDNPILWLITDPAIITICTVAGWIAGMEKS